MATRIFLKLDTEPEAHAWVAVLRTLGLEVLGRPTDKLSHDGSWTVRAIARDDQHPTARAAS
jgi:hypothetical protein